MTRSSPFPASCLEHNTRTFNASSAFSPGAGVVVVRTRLDTRPIIEGHATLVAHAGIDGLPDLWRVRFLGEEVTRLRLVHGGVWQAHPDTMLRALTQEWRLGLQPELLFESPLPERR